MPSNPTQTGYLDLAQIRRKYPSQWVLLGSPETTDMQEILGGVVVWHGHSREEMYSVAAGHPEPRRFASLHTNLVAEPPDEDTEILL